MRELADPDGRWQRVADMLGGRGVPSVAAVLRDLELAPLHDAINRLWSARNSDAFDAADSDLQWALTTLGGDPSAALKTREWFTSRPPFVDGWDDARITDELAEETVILDRAWTFSAGIEASVAGRPDLAHGQWLDKWRLKPLLTSVIRDMNLGPMQDGFEDVMPLVLSAVLRGIHLAVPEAKGDPLDLGPLADPDVAAAIGLHEYDGTTWFNRERFIRTIEWLVVPELERDSSWPRQSAAMDVVERMAHAAEQAGYRLDNLNKLLAEPLDWPSTRKPRPVPRGGRSANKRDMSMPDRPAPKSIRTTTRKAAPPKAVAKSANAAKAPTKAPTVAKVPEGGTPPTVKPNVPVSTAKPRPIKPVKSVKPARSP
jgi:hypothetical protein